MTGATDNIPRELIESIKDGVLAGWRESGAITPEIALLGELHLPDTFLIPGAGLDGIRVKNPDTGEEESLSEVWTKAREARVAATLEAQGRSLDDIRVEDRFQQRGSLMGTPTSWFTLCLYNVLLLQVSREAFDHDVDYPWPGTDPSGYIRKLLRRFLARDRGPTRFTGICGDDLWHMDRFRVCDIYAQLLRATGGTPSEGSHLVSQYLSVFTEDVAIRGTKLKHTLLADDMIFCKSMTSGNDLREDRRSAQQNLAPGITRGDAVRAQITYQRTTFEQQEAEGIPRAQMKFASRQYLALSGLLYQAYRSEYQVARRNNRPIFLPRSLGGLGVPFPGSIQDIYKTCGGPTKQVLRNLTPDESSQAVLRGVLLNPFSGDSPHGMSIDGWNGYVDVLSQRLDAGGGVRPRSHVIDELIQTIPADAPGGLHKWEVDLAIRNEAKKAADRGNPPEVKCQADIRTHMITFNAQNRLLDRNHYLSEGAAISHLKRSVCQLSCLASLPVGRPNPRVRTMVDYLRLSRKAERKYLETFPQDNPRGRPPKTWMDLRGKMGNYSHGRQFRDDDTVWLAIKRELAGDFSMPPRPGELDVE
jgi:hypothetical protein